MQLNREWLMYDLHNLSGDRSEIDRLSSELKELKLNYITLKAKRYDSLSFSSTGNFQRDRLELNLAKQEEIDQILKYKKSHVENMERLLNQLSDDDREIIESMVITHTKTAAEIGEEIGYEVRQIHNKKQNAIEKLLQLRFGQGYQP